MQTDRPLPGGRLVLTIYAFPLARARFMVVVVVITLLEQVKL